MKKIVELPLLEPLYSTYHGQGTATATLTESPSLVNWYYNEVLILSCNRKFLNGYTSPQINIRNSEWSANPYFHTHNYYNRYLKGYVHYVIRNLIDDGYYVFFNGVDDYYVEGKSWCHEKHFAHNGCICGYNQGDKTYCIYAYDKDWIYRKFWTPQKSLFAGMKAMFKQGKYNGITGIKPKKHRISFSADIALKTISEYLNSSPEKYPETEDDTVYGIAVHDFIAKYIDKLYDGSIPYERMDRRVFRLIWEHKKVMLKRIELIEEAMSFDNTISEAYKDVVREADNCRMLYASHHMKQRNSLLPIIRKKLLSLKSLEQNLLTELLKKAKGEKSE